MIQLTESIAVEEKDIQLEFIRASGPGGQNVNKVSSGVQLRFDTSSASLPDDVRARLKRLAKNRINDEGALIIEAKSYRTQEQNRKDAFDRLAQLIEKASIKPKKRQPTRPTAASKQRRLATKKRRSEIKRMRGSDLPGDDF
jgi:ribosome-associated protein